MRKRINVFILIILLIILIIAIVLLLNINKKIKVNDILGKWSYTNSLGESVSVYFKNDGNLVFTDDDGSAFEYGYRLSYGSNSTTYINMDCPYNNPESAKKGEYCYFADFQPIGLVDNKLCFLGGSFQVCFDYEQ